MTRGEGLFLQFRKKRRIILFFCLLIQCRKEENANERIYAIFFAFYIREGEGEKRETKSNISDSRMTEQEEEEKDIEREKKFFCDVAGIDLA